MSVQDIDKYKLPAYLKERKCDGNKDSTNTRLGLTVSNNVNSTTLSKADFNPAVENLENLPNSSIFYPKGTVLKGTNTSEENTDKKLQLEIYYTEPK